MAHITTLLVPRPLWKKPEALNAEATHLCVLHVPQHDLGVEHVGQLGHHLALNGKLLVEQRQVVLQLPVRGDEDAFALGVVLRPARSSQHLGGDSNQRATAQSFRPDSGLLHHRTSPSTCPLWVLLASYTQHAFPTKNNSEAPYLQDVQRSQLSPAALLGTVHLGAFDDDGVGREVHTPSQGCRGN